MTWRSRFILTVVGASPWVAWSGARAQTHAVKKPETVVRAVAVYEWTGPEDKPTASRVVPVSIFINSQLEDAGVYMARPVPFALDRGNIFEVEQAGKPEGTVELSFQRHLEGTGDNPFDDGWLGYGIFKPAPKPTEYAGKQRGPVPQVVASGGTRPQFSNKPGGSTTTASNTDTSRPTMQRRSGTDDASSGSTSTASSGSTTASASDSNKPVLQKKSDSSDTSASSTDPDDYNRPVLVRREGSDSPDTSTSAKTSSSTSASTGSSTPSSTASSTTTASTTSDSSDDADRPTLKKRTPGQSSKPAPRRGDQASVSSAGDLNNDPDRPTLHRGTAVEPEIPPLNGLPADMHQMVAVSDAKNRPEHSFVRPWDSESERADVLAKMQDVARAKLANYDVPAPATAAATPAPAAKPGVRTKKQAAPASPPPAPVTLTNESLRGYTLSYGGADTFVYGASSPGAKGVTRYVTVVAQREPLGELKVAMTSVTDSKHLDRTPWMRLVDVVDAEASNRASLLFEMREQSARQFALYRVIGAQAELLFQTGTTE
jgi:hypothetical protein